MRRLAGLRAVHQVALTGSLRRGRDTVKDIDIVVASEQPPAVIAAFCGFPEVAAVWQRGSTKVSVMLHAGFGCDLRVVAPVDFAAARQYFTGSQLHNVRLRGLVRERGLKLNEYGLFVRPGPEGDDRKEVRERLPAATERQLYEHLGLPYIVPELREDRGEIEAALDGRLPELVRLQDLRGDLHVHSNWSDGRHSIEQMHAAAAARGLEYIAITDHSPLVAVTRGLGPGRLAEQVDTIRRLRDQLTRPYLLTGVEVDIRADGTLDLPDPVLADLDVVIASVHSRFNLGSAAMTARIVAALENPHVDILGHATGRLIGRRDAYAVDMDVVLAAAAETGTVVEINASPERLDIRDVHVRTAVQRGVWLAVGSDAHSEAGFAVARFGVQVARRGWATADNIINTWPLPKLLSFLQSPKSDRRSHA